MANSSTLLLDAPAVTPLSSTSLHLMPFHISHTGPAPISSYFLIKRALQDTTSVQGETKVLEKGKSVEEPGLTKLTAAFRGRVMHGFQVDIPESYDGFLLAKEGDQDEVAQSSGKKRKGDDVEEGTVKDGGSKSRKSTGKGKATTAKGRITRSRSKGKKGRNDGSEEEEAPTNPEDVYAFMSQVDVDDAPPPDQANDSLPDTSRDDTRSLHPAATFSSFTLWNADVPPDEGQDEYLRTMKEWVKLADIIHQPEDDADSIPPPPFEDR